MGSQVTQIIKGEMLTQQLLLFASPLLRGRLTSLKSGEK